MWVGIRASLGLGTYECFKQGRLVPERTYCFASALPNPEKSARACQLQMSGVLKYSLNSQREARTWPVQWFCGGSDRTEKLEERRDSQPARDNDAVQAI